MSAEERERRDVSVRRTGAEIRPWEARCRIHRATRDEELYFGRDGAVAFNTLGIGNRTWELAMQAADFHLRKFHPAPAGDEHGWAATRPQVRVVMLPEISDIQAPTVAELGAGQDLTLHFGPRHPAESVDAAIARGWPYVLPPDAEST